MIIGIDFSIKSPAITVKSNLGTIRYHSFPRRSVIKEDFAITLQKYGVMLHVLEDEKPLSKNANLTDRERSSMHDSLMEIDAIVEVLRQYPIDDETYIAIEGFSFASTGNRLAQISGYQWALRTRLIRELGVKIENIWLFSPMTVKATAGKGNYKKEEMIEEFIKASPADSKFARMLRDSPAEFQNKKGGWLKPLDDIVDSYWVACTLEKTISKA